MHYKRALITGGAGFIGSHIAEAVLERWPSCHVILLDSFVRGRRENVATLMDDPRVRVVHGDIRDRELVMALMTGVDLLFHQAALRITQCAAEPRAAMEVMVQGTFDLLETAVHAGVRKVVAASTASVYGDAETYPTTERHHPYNNRTLYGAAKMFNEGLLRSFNEMYGLQYVALRYFNVYGPRMDIHGAYTEVLIRWMERIAAGAPPVILGDGSQTMDFVFVKDVARANVLAAAADANDAVFNVATGVETSLRDLAAALTRVMHADLAPEFGPARKVNNVPRRLADITAAERALGFRATTSLDEGLRQLVSWWRAQQVETPAGHA